MIAQVSPGDFCELETHLNYHVYSPFTKIYSFSKKFFFSIYLQNVFISNFWLLYKTKKENQRGRLNESENKINVD